MNRFVAGIVFFIAIMALYWGMGKSKDIDQGGSLVFGTVQDASGLPVGTPVHLAGIPVGVIESLALTGSNAELAIRLKQGVVIYEDAVLLKKSPSILSEPVLELSSGSKGSPPLKNGGSILRTTESPHLDDSIRSLKREIPEFGEGALAFKNEVDKAHQKLESDIFPKFEEWTKKIDTFSDDTQQGLADADDKIGGIEESVKLDANKEIGKKLDNAVETTSKWPKQVSQYTPKVKDIGATSREKISSIAIEARDKWKDFAKDANQVDQGEGQLGKLINNSDLADSLESGVQGTLNAVKTLTGWTMGLTMRAEMQAASGLPQFYFSIQAQRKPQSFYLMEIVKNSRGRVFQDLSYDHSLGRFRQNAIVKERISFSLQWGYILRNFAFRGGIKESSLGAGMDMFLWDDRIRLSSDLYGFGFSKKPRLRVSANMKVYGALHATAGVADVLNPGTTLPIEAFGDTVPIQFEEYRYGRDFFLGGELQVTDRDIAGLLFLGKNAISNMGE